MEQDQFKYTQISYIHCDQKAIFDSWSIWHWNNYLHLYLSHTYLLIPFRCQTGITICTLTFILKCFFFLLLCLASPIQSRNQIFWLALWTTLIYIINLIVYLVFNYHNNNYIGCFISHFVRVAWFVLPESAFLTSCSFFFSFILCQHSSEINGHIFFI